MSVTVDASVTPIQVSITKVAGIGASAMNTLIDSLVYSGTRHGPRPPTRSP